MMLIVEILPNATDVHGKDLRDLAGARFDVLEIHDDVIYLKNHGWTIALGKDYIKFINV